MVRLVAAIALFAGCGRVGFDPFGPSGTAGDDGDDAPNGDANGSEGNPPPVPPGSVLVFHFDETSGATATSENGSIIGDVEGGATWVAGRRAGSIRLVTGAFIDLPSLPALRITGPLAISFWYRLDRMTANSECIPTLIHGDVNGGGSSSNALYSINLYRPQVIYFSERQNQVNNGTSTPFPTSAFDPDIWHHLVLVRAASGNVTFYFDNGAAMPLPATPPVDGGEAGHLRIGADLEPSVCMGFPGRLDELYIYDRALDTAEIAMLFQAVD